VLQLAAAVVAGVDAWKLDDNDEIVFLKFVDDDANGDDVHASTPTRDDVVVDANNVCHDIKNNSNTEQSNIVVVLVVVVVNIAGYNVLASRNSVLLD
jgi:hypothetical protein